MSKFMIENRCVGAGEPVFIIAEIGINHQGSVEISKRLIDAAAAAGVDAVKFQKRDNKNLFTNDAYNAPYTNGGNSFGDTYGEHREHLELSAEDYVELKRYSREKGVIFFASAWDHESVDFLMDLGVPAMKIGSPDLTNIPLCIYIAKKKLPVILSTGMSEQWEIDMAVKKIRRYNDALAVLHCVSIYPAEFGDLNLGMIPRLMDRFGLPVGYSGHEMGWSAVIAAVAMGACVIEKHITLDRTMKGGDHRFSMEPDELREMVSQVRNVEKSLVSGDKCLMEKEIPFRRKLGKSVVARRPIEKDEVIRKEMLTCKCPATGISPTLFERIIGKKALKDISIDGVMGGDDVAVA